MDFTGPAFTVSSSENGVYKALEIARNLLSSREVDAVVLGAVDLGGGIESVLARQAIQPIHTGPVSMGWNHSSQGWAIGEGAGAIVLKRADETTHDRVYARLDDLAIVQSDYTSLRGKVSANAVAEAAQQVLNRQQLSPADIGYLEVSGSGIAEESQVEIAGLTQLTAVPMPNSPAPWAAVKPTSGIRLRLRELHRSFKRRCRSIIDCYRAFPTGKGLPQRNRLSALHFTFLTIHDPGFLKKVRTCSGQRSTALLPMERAPTYSCQKELTRNRTSRRRTYYVVENDFSQFRKVLLMSW